MHASLRTVLIFALAAGFVGCIDPDESRPGLRLSGEVAEEFPSDWDFTNDHPKIAIQVATPYLIPHSVTIWCAAAGEHLYVAARNPDERRWPGWVARDPDVRLRIGEQIHEVRLALVDDADEIARVRRAYAVKYELSEPTPEGGPPVRYWRVGPRS